MPKDSLTSSSSAPIKEFYFARSHGNHFPLYPYVSQNLLPVMRITDPLAFGALPKTNGAYRIKAFQAGDIFDYILSDATDQDLPFNFIEH